MFECGAAFEDIFTCQGSLLTVPLDGSAPVEVRRWIHPETLQASQPADPMPLPPEPAPEPPAPVAEPPAPSVAPPEPPAAKRKPRRGGGGRTPLRGGSGHARGRQGRQSRRWERLWGACSESGASGPRGGSSRNRWRGVKLSVDGL